MNSFWLNILFLPIQLVCTVFVIVIVLIYYIITVTFQKLSSGEEMTEK